MRLVKHQEEEGQRVLKKIKTEKQIFMTIGKNIMQEYIDGEQLAQKIGVTLKTIRKWAYQNRIPGAVRFGARCVRYRITDIEKALLRGDFLVKRN